jgi:hypothetical protein
MYLASRQSAVPDRCVSLTFSQALLEIVDLAPVALEEGVCVNELLLLRVQGPGFCQCMASTLAKND